MQQPSHRTIRLGALWIALLTACGGGSSSPADYVVEMAGSGNGNTPPVPLDLSAIAKHLVPSASGYPARFQLWGNSTVDRADFFARAADAFELTTTDDMQPSATIELSGGLAITTHQLVANGIPVENAIYNLIDRQGHVVGGSGRIVPGLALDTKPAISDADALAVATPIGSTYIWKVLPGMVAPTPRLTFYSPDFGNKQPFRLVYRVDYAALSPPEAWVAHVDALTGTLVDRKRVDAAISTGDVGATGLRQDGVSVKFSTVSSGGTPPTYRLREYSARDIHTHDGGLDTSTFLDFTDLDNAWTEMAVRRGVSAHWAAEKAWDYLGTMGIEGIDGTGTVTLNVASINVGQSCGQTLTFNDGSTQEHLSLLCNQDLDIESVAHEIGHAATNAHVLFDDDPETTAISESLADIFATSVNHFAGAPDGDWLLFDSGGSPNAIWRDLANPNSHLQPDTYEGVYWTSEMAKPAPDGHVLAGVPNHWFYLLAEGGIGVNDNGAAYTVVPLGRFAAEKIAIMTIANSGALGSGAKLLDLRRETIANATLIFGDRSFEVAQVAAAWDAVGVLDPISDTDPWHLPETGEEGVSAWPAQLTFETPFCSTHSPGCGTEVAWMVQISTDPAFLTGVQQQLVSSQQSVGGKIVSSAQFTLHPGTVYFWRVKSQDSHGNWAAWRFTASFLTGRQQPRQCDPTPTSPDVHPWPAHVSCEAVLGAVGYEVEVARDPAFSQVIAGLATVSTPSWDVNLPLDTTLFWRMRAVGPAGTKGDWSTMHDTKGTTDSWIEQETPWIPANAIVFATSDPVPSPVAPADEAIVHPFTVGLEVASNGATAYEFQYDTDNSDCDLELGHIDKAQGTTLDVSVDPKSTLWWCVRGVGYFGDHTHWSAQRTVLVDAGTPRLIAPNNIAVDPWFINFQWTPMDGASSYNLDVSTDPAFSKVVYTIDLDGKTESWPIDVSAKGPTQYYWRLKALGGPNLAATPWASAAFTIDPTLTIPVQIAPAANAVVTHQDVTFSWQALQRASGYRVTVWKDGSEYTTLDTSGTSAVTTLPWSASLAWSVHASLNGDEGMESPATAFTVAQPDTTCAEFDAVVDATAGYYTFIPIPLPSYANRNVAIELTPSANVSSWGYTVYSEYPYVIYDASLDWASNGTKYGAYQLGPNATNFWIQVVLRCLPNNAQPCSGVVHVKAKCP
jgi:Zn-dependent metalloprotease